MRTDFTRAVLRGSDLRGAHAHRARFLEADMTGANLAGCDLTDAELEV
ncbi:MAG: pentapeptide repeat-containing protein [Phenylobacterium sp.]